MHGYTENISSLMLHVEALQKQRQGNAANYFPLEWASIHCESKLEKQDLQARESW